MAAAAALGVAAAGASETRRAADAVIAADDGTEFAPSDVHIEPGEKVTWTFDNPNTVHNVAARPDSPTAWTFRTGYAVDHPDVEHTFPDAGTYTFRCEAHGGMDGTVFVGGGAPTTTPTVSPTTSPTVSATATPTATPIATPAPSPPQGSPPDVLAPRVSALSARVAGRAIVVRFQISERARVTVTLRKQRTVKSARVVVGAGRHTIRLRPRSLKRGRYLVDIAATDTAGNPSSRGRVSVRVRRGR